MGVVTLISTVGILVPCVVLRTLFRPVWIIVGLTLCSRLPLFSVMTSLLMLGARA